MRSLSILKDGGSAIAIRVS